MYRSKAWSAHDQGLRAVSAGIAVLAPEYGPTASGASFVAEEKMTEAQRNPADAHMARPSPAGMYDFWLGGTANTPADRDAAERVIRVIPEIRQVAWANRGFLLRVVTWLTGECGIQQFIDIGAGLPTQRPTHEIARTITDDARVIYTDADPQVVARGHEMLAGVPGVAVIEADIRQPGVVLDHPQTRLLIDFAQPTALLMVAVTQFVPDHDDPWTLVRRYVDALAPGSYLALSAPTGDHKVNWRVDRTLDVYAGSTAPATVRSKSQFERFFAGLEILPPYDGAEPTVTHVGLWGAEDVEAADDDAARWFYAAVARKPGATDHGYQAHPGHR
jgi:SAM-dependent methyltransferase